MPPRRPVSRVQPPKATLKDKLTLAGTRLINGAGATALGVASGAAAAVNSPLGEVYPNGARIAGGIAGGLAGLAGYVGYKAGQSNSDTGKEAPFYHVLSGRQHKR